MVARIAKGVMALDEEIAELDALIEDRFHEHAHADVIRSLPGMGALLGAEFIAATGGDLEVFVVLPRRWVVERTLAWLMHARRHARDYERLVQHSEALITWAPLPS